MALRHSVGEIAYCSLLSAILLLPAAQHTCFWQVKYWYYN